MAPGGEDDARLRQLEQQLAALRQQQEQLIATVSHELRTPLVAGLGYVEMLVEGRLGPLPEKAAPRMRAAADNLHWLARRIDDLVGYHRLLGPDSPPPRPQPVPLARLLRAHLAAPPADHARRPARCTLELDPAAVAFAEEAALQRILGQLLDNAARHNPAEVAVVLRTAVDGPRTVRLEVVDDGAGIGPLQLARLNGALADGAAGAGPGLQLAGLLVRRAGGALQLASRPGAGTVATLTLPAAPGPTEEG